MRKDTMRSKEAGKVMGGSKTAVRRERGKGGDIGRRRVREEGKGKGEGR